MRPPSRPKLPQPTRRQLLRAVCSGGLLAAGPGWPQTRHTRVALVIGNAAYAGAPLPNAAKDARAMATLLVGMGFEVIELRDATKPAMEAAVAQAHDRLKGRAGVGLLYYAGHGLQIDWRNYLMPVDAAPASAADVPHLAVDMQTVIDAFQSAGNLMNILVLDACRDNPFAASASARGLAPQNAPPGTFLAYATAPGHVAEDGSAADGNGLYTRFLLQELKRPEARIEDIFKRVRLQVRQASQGRQVPWESTSLEQDFVFALGEPALQESNRQAAIAAELAAWNRIKDSQRPEDFYALLQQYPNGRVAELAQFRLDQIAATAVAPVTGADGLVHLASGQRRFLVGDAVQRELINYLAGTRRRVWLRVTAADDREAVINRGQGIVDQMGGLARDFYGVRTPPMLEVPSGLSVGKRWRAAWRNRTPSGQWEDCFKDYRVTSVETLELDSGRFRCYRIEGQGEVSSSSYLLYWQSVKWVDPSTMLVMRQRDTIKVSTGLMHLDNEFVVTAIELAPRT